jgi:thymidylate synthase (FAD)
MLDSPVTHELNDDQLGTKDQALLSGRILRQGLPHDPLNPPHESVLEHVVYTFELEFSRAVLQELARHRIASLSVQSTRWALKRLVDQIDDEDLDTYLTQTGDPEIDAGARKQLEILLEQVRRGKTNDKTKYLVGEAFRSKAMITINARSLRNLFVLRTSPRALWEIRQLAFAMAEAVPTTHRFLFEDRMHANKEAQ